jgi:hypothetical protein
VGLIEREMTPAEPKPCPDAATKIQHAPNGIEILADFISIRTSKLGELCIPLDFEENLVSLRRYDLANLVSYCGAASPYTCSS